MENEKKIIAQALKMHHDAHFTPGVYEHSVFGKAALLLEANAVEVTRCSGKQLINMHDCPCDGCKAKPCGHPARCLKFAEWLNKTVDAVEVVHGRWEKVKQDLGDGIKTYRFGCSECGYLKNTLTGNYCPNCGAKMDGERREDNATG